MPIDEFINKCAYNIPENVQNHINKLTKVAYVWMKKGRIEDSAKLVDYIYVLKMNFQNVQKLLI